MIYVKNFGETPSCLVKEAMEIVKNGRRELVTTGDLLIAIIQRSDCAAARFLQDFGINSSSIGKIEAEIILKDESPKRRAGTMTTELAMTYLTASLIPLRFGDQFTTDLHLLTALLFTKDDNSDSIFMVAADDRIALMAMEQLGVDLEKFRAKLLPKLVHSPIRRPIMERY